MRLLLLVALLVGCLAVQLRSLDKLKETTDPVLDRFQQLRSTKYILRAPFAGSKEFEGMTLPTPPVPESPPPAPAQGLVGEGRFYPPPPKTPPPLPPPFPLPMMKPGNQPAPSLLESWSRNPSSKP